MWTCGACAGALVTSSGFYLAGRLFAEVPVEPRFLVGLLVTVALVLISLSPASRLLPQTHRQIARSRVGARKLSAAFLFAFELGTGVRTYVPSVAPYLLAVYLLLFASSLETIVSVGVAFGVGRSVFMWARGLGFGWHPRSSSFGVFERWVAPLLVACAVVGASR